MPTNYVFQPKKNYLEMAHTNCVSSIRERAYQPAICTTYNNKHVFGNSIISKKSSFGTYFQNSNFSNFNLLTKLKTNRFSILVVTNKRKTAIFLFFPVRWWRCDAEDMESITSSSFENSRDVLTWETSGMDVLDTL